MTSKFSIKDLERLSGIKAHTIRIWEQRYNLLSPERTDTNIRYYSNEDLKVILNVSLLNNHGIKISKIASLSYQDISNEVAKLMNATLNDTEHINTLIISMIELDEDKFESFISTCIEKNGFQHAVINVIYPFLEKIGIMWLTGTINPAQEHFISNLIRQKFIVAIDQQKNKRAPEGRSILLYLPEGELHELSILFYNYLLRQNGHKTTYLGQSVPFDDLVAVTEVVKPDYILSVITNQFKENSLDDFLDLHEKHFGAYKVILSGYQFSNNPTYRTRQNIIIPDSPIELLSLLNNLK